MSSGFWLALGLTVYVFNMAIVVQPGTSFLTGGLNMILLFIQIYCGYRQTISYVTNNQQEKRRYEIQKKTGCY